MPDGATKRYWDTGDSPTDANLNYLESLAQNWRGMTVEHFMDKLRGVIGVEKMLPKAVRSHFSLPFLFIGDAAYSWSDARLAEKTSELCTAIEAGLAAAFADNSLKRHGGADLSDRPATKGEELRVALTAYRENRGTAELSNLRQVCYGTRLHSRMDQLNKWLARKRPSSPDRPIEYEIASVLGDIGRHVDDYHCEPASYAFASGRT